MKILVTGGAGFIGSHIVEALLKKGYSVRVLDNLSTGKRENLSRVMDEIDFVKGDITNIDTVQKVCEDIEGIIHLAAISSVPESIKNPEKVKSINVDGTLNILEVAKKFNIKRVVYSSSASVYGDNEEKLNERTKLNPLSPYACSKLQSEKYMELFSKKSVETICLRYFNVYGPKQNPLSNYSGVITIFINKMLKGEAPIIYGDGSNTRDFVFVEDIVNANILALEKKDYNFKIYNIASGKSISLKNLTQLLNKLLEENLQPIYAEKRLGDILNSSSDISLAQNELGWKPKVSFEEGLKKTLKYFLKNSGD